LISDDDPKSTQTVDLFYVKTYNNTKSTYDNHQDNMTIYSTSVDNVVDINVIIVFKLIEIVIMFERWNFNHGKVIIKYLLYAF